MHTDITRASWCDFRFDENKITSNIEKKALAFFFNNL